MTMVAKSLENTLKLAIIAALNTEFKDEAKTNKAAAENHQKLANALAKAISEEVVKFLQSQVQVAPGIPTAGSAAAQVTTGPGKLI